METPLEAGTSRPHVALWARLRVARWLWVPLAAFALSRSLLFAVAYVGGALLPDDPNAYHLRGTDNLLLDVFASRWDTGFYVSIAEEGYQNEAEPFPSTAFWPLLPLLMRALATLTGDVALAGVLISNAALLGAMVLLYRLTDAEWGPAVAERAVWYLLIFPASLFGSAIYTESLYLLCSIGALALARNRLWESSALLGMAGALTRLVGITMMPVLLAEWWRQRRAGDRPPLLGAALVCLVPLGTLAFMLFLQLRFGDPLAFLRASAAWEREPQSPLALIAELFRVPPGGWGAALASGRFGLNEWLDFLTVLLFLGLGLRLLAERRWPEGLLITLGVLLPMSSGLLFSQRRYMWVLFPAFVLLARWGGQPWVDRVITAVSLAFLALYTVLFANGYWVA
ncbi:MAG: hypothetical protein OHK0015_07320 [Chloroflexi bacterium OHK40]